jgi:glucose/arabinose dehydrogenase
MRRTGPIGLVVVVLALVAAACGPNPPPPPPPLPDETVHLTLVNNVGPNAITMATRPNDSMLYVATQDGKIYAINPADSSRTLVMDLNSPPGLIQHGGEQGFLGMTFSADGTKLYVHYTSPLNGGTTTVAEYAATPAAPAPVTTLTSPRIVFQNDHSFASNHNGGSLLLGPDGMLYLALGDGGGGNDGFQPSGPYSAGHLLGGNAQSLESVQGKILRIDPTASLSPPMPYTIPVDNPFVGVVDVGGAARGEIWANGLRNPFRFSFDKTTGDLWIGDVGQGLREEVDFVAATDPAHTPGKGLNFGWNRREGNIVGPETRFPPRGSQQLTGPIFDYDHSHGDCAIIGGYAYRGTAIPGLVGQYLYTDNCNGEIRSLTRSGTTAQNRDLHAPVNAPSSFGQDNNGELYVLSLSGGLYKIGP